MKKFLSILLALAVGFTFTFGSAMSAFAAPSAGDKAKSLLDEAYRTAVATEFDVDYDTTNTSANDITVFTVNKAAVQAGIYAAYQATKTAINDSNANNVLGVDTTNADSDAKKIAALRVALETSAVTGGANVADSLDAAFDAYKAALVDIVNAISTDKYTTTSYEDLGVPIFTAKNGNTYETSREAANADKQWALDAIAKAKFNVAGAADASTEAKWNTTYENLYTKVFGEVFTLVEHKDDVTNTGKVTSVSYDLKNPAYSTDAKEKGAAATLEVQKAQAKATLVKVITTFEVSAAYKPAYANAVAAYKECMEYLIDNATTDPTGLVGKDISAATSTTVTLTGGTAVNYIDRTADAAKAKADAASNKQVAGIQGAYYDDAKAAKALKAVLMAVYGGTTYDSATQTAGVYTLYSAYAKLTAGEKAKLKAARDYSEVEADASNEFTFKTYNTGTLANAKYYAKEFEAVKAAVDEYCAAIDKAETQLDVDKAEEAFKAATLNKKIEKAGDVKTTITKVDDSVLSAYFTKVKGSNDIYITWDGGKAYDNSFVKDHYVQFLIAKGARTVKEADALYAEACAVIDAYKTKAQLTTEAAAVQAKIEALPATITLADKAAVAEAAKAYTDLASQFRDYVANASKLKNAVKKLENLEAAEVIKLINALPALSKVTVADKAAIKAAADAYKAWVKEDMYNETAFVPTRTPVTDITAAGSYTDKLQAAEKQALQDAYTPLGAKWAVDAITLDDADAVKALQEATAAYIAEYNDPLGFEASLEKIAALINNLAKFTADDAKAYVQDLSIAVRTAKVGKKVKVTVKADVQKLVDNGYTVTYKFYKSTKKGSGYKNTVNKTTNTYTNTNPVKGKNYYKVKLVVKNADGAVVATTPLTQCKYGVRTIK